MRMILLGPPGAGKGTQAKLVSMRLGVPHISTGQILRSALEQRSPLGLRAQKYMSEGQLVPDDLVVDLVQDRLKQEDCRKGYVLDGFPRNLRQAKSLTNRHTVVLLKVATEELVRRLSGRRHCPQCGENYHESFHPPRERGRCDHCRSELQQRDDDREEVVRKRLDVYRDETSPLVEYYHSRKELKEIPGEGGVDEIFQKLLRVVEP